MYMHTIIEFIKISIKKYMYQNIEKKYNKQLKNHFFSLFIFEYISRYRNKI